MVTKMFIAIHGQSFTSISCCNILMRDTVLCKCCLTLVVVIDFTFSSSREATQYNTLFKQVPR